MTPPSKASGVKADASVEANVPAPKPADKKTTENVKKTSEETVVDDNPEKKWVPSFTLGTGWGAQGDRNGTLFAIKSQSEYGDYQHLWLNGTVMRDLVGDKVRFRIGPRIDVFGIFGNENTGGSKYGAITGGAQIELDWNRAYGAGLWGVLKGPSYVFINGGIGYLGGNGTAGTYSLHDQSAFAANLGAGLNVFNVNVKGLQIGADFLFSTVTGYGSDHNTPGNAFGFGITFRPSTTVKKVTVEKNYCEDVPAKVGNMVAQNQELRAGNTKVKEDLDTLRSFLEKGDNPITTEKIQKALFYREVRKSVAAALPDVKEEDIRKSIREAFDAKDDATADAILKKGVPGLTDDTLAKAKDAAGKKYPPGYDFWAQVTGDPLPTNVPDPLPTDCDKLDKLYDELIDENRELTKRNRDLNGRFDTALLLDALRDHLSKNVEKFVDRAHGFVLDFVQPNFTLADPTEKNLQQLRDFYAKKKGQEVKPDDPELLKISKGMFALPEWEMQNFKDLADKMTGKVDPSFTRTFTEKDKAKKFDQAPEIKDEDKKKYEWIKEITWFVEGHTDSQGTNAANQSLSDRRSEGAKLYLQIFGVPEANLESKGYGEERLAVPETGSFRAIQTAQTKNRRVVIRVKGEKPSATLQSIPDGKSIHVNPDKEAPEGEPKDKTGAPKKDRPRDKPKDTKAPDPKQPPAPPPTDPKPTGAKDDKKKGTGIVFDDDK